MPPEFRFQTILNLRRRTEDERQMELAQTLQQAASLRAQRDRLLAERLRLSTRLKEALRGLWDGSDVERQYRYLESLDRRLHHLAEDIRQADEEVTAQRHRLAEAMKERKTMEKLKEYQRRTFLAHYLHKEQEQMDDLNVTRYARST